MTDREQAQSQQGYVHCERCGVVEGNGNRGDFDECPHENDNCEVGSACADCCIMADIACRY